MHACMHTQESQLNSSCDNTLGMGKSAIQTLFWQTLGTTATMQHLAAPVIAIRVCLGAVELAHGLLVVAPPAQLDRHAGCHRCR